MTDIARTTAANSRNLQSLYSQRKASIARQYGEDHTAISRNGEASFFITHDVDMVYMSEFMVKFVIDGKINATAGGTSITSTLGTNKYPTFDAWLVDYHEGVFVDVDGEWGCQCVDLVNALWMAQANRYIKTGPNHSAYEIWTVSRDANAGLEFNLILNHTSIRRGDIIVWSGGDYGHVAIAKENYDPSKNGYIEVYGQNQGGIAYPGGGSAINVISLSLNQNFLGAFRYKGWS